MRWYSIVANDLSKLYPAIEYYLKEYDQAKQECKLYGNIEKASSTLPGIVELRFSQLQEIEAILELLNIEQKRIRSQVFQRYLETYQRALSSRDCEKYVDGEKDVVEMEKLINEFALVRNQWLGIIKALEIKQWQLTNIIKLRTAGLDDASL